MKSISMRMDYQLPPQQTLQIGGGGGGGGVILPNGTGSTTSNSSSVTSSHLQILQNVHQQHQQHQQQQQQILSSMQPPSSLPPLSSLPLSVVHNLPHLVAAAGGGGGAAGGANTQTINLSCNNNNTNNNNNNNNGNSNSNNNNTNSSNNSNTTNQTSAVVNNHNHVTQNLPPTSQILHHHLHHLTNNNNSNNSNNSNNNNNNNNNQTPNHNTGNNTATGNHLVTTNNGTDDNNTRWTQFQQVQQLWRHHAYLNGKSGNSKDICGDDKFKEDGDPWNVEAQAAFLGPNLWDKTLPYDADLKVTQYADLDEFLSENNIPDGLPGTHLGHSTSLGHRSDSLGHSTSLSLGLGHITTKRERSPSPSDCVSPDTINPPSPAESTFSFASSGRDFDPRTRAFSDEELKPQPMIKKSRKQFVPDELKDDKYWARRRKNNIAAKRSRDARRQKENQIAMRARYLEKENSTLHQEVEQLKQENMELRARLSKYQEV